MAEGFSLTVTGVKEYTARLSALPKRLRERMIVEMGHAVDVIVQQARANVGRLFRDPARMQESISGHVEVKSYDVVGHVEARGLPYLRIQEYGGTVQTPALPKTRSILVHTLKFEAGGEILFRPHTRAHPTRIPERSYLRAAIEQRRGEILAGFMGITEEL